MTTTSTPECNEIINKPKYKMGDILQHNIYPDHKIKIVWTFSVFYDETGYSKDIYYQTAIITNPKSNQTNEDCLPISMSETDIDTYYSIL